MIVTVLHKKSSGCGGDEDLTPSLSLPKWKWCLFHPSRGWLGGSLCEVPDGGARHEWSAVEDGENCGKILTNEQTEFTHLCLS